MDRFEVVIDLIKRFDCKLVAEIGVQRALSAKQILASCDLERYIMVEPKWYEEIVNQTEKYQVARFIHATSEVAAQSIPDGTLDLVFIDALHKYEDVRQDIDLWMPKVKAGGIMCGDDYEGKKYPGVTKAVLETFDESDVKAVSVGKGKVKVWWTQLPPMKIQEVNDNGKEGCQGSNKEI